MSTEDDPRPDLFPTEGPPVPTTYQGPDVKGGFTGQGLWIIDRLCWSTLVTVRERTLVLFLPHVWGGPTSNENRTKKGSGRDGTHPTPSPWVGQRWRSSVCHPSASRFHPPVQKDSDPTPSRETRAGVPGPPHNGCRPLSKEEDL